MGPLDLERQPLMWQGHSIARVYFQSIAEEKFKLRETIWLVEGRPIEAAPHEKAGRGAQCETTPPGSAGSGPCVTFSKNKINFADFIGTGSHVAGSLGTYLDAWICDDFV